MFKKNIYWLLISVLMICSCSRNKTAGNVDHAADSIARIEYVEAQDLAIRHSYDSALVKINTCVEREGVTDSVLADALVLKAQIQHATYDLTGTITTAQEAASLCRRLGGEYTCFAYDMDSRAAGVMFLMGRMDESFILIDQCIDELKDDRDFYNQQALFNCMKRKLNILIQIDSVAPIIPLCDDALRRLSLLRSGKSNVILDDYHIKHPEEIETMADFYSGQFLAYKANALLETNHKEEARMCVDSCLTTNWGKGRNAGTLLVNCFNKLGMYDRLQSSLENLKQVHNRGGEASQEILAAEAALYRHLGDHKRESELLSQALDEAVKVRKQENHDKLTVLATVYQVSQQKEARLRAEANQVIYLLISVIAVIVIIALCVWIVIRHRKYKEILAAYNDIQEKYFDSSLQQTENIPVSGLDTVEQGGKENNVYDSPAVQNEVSGFDTSVLFAQIMNVMRTEKLYSDPDFNLDALARKVNSNRTYVSKAINEVAGSTFKMWLAECRNKVVIDLLRSNPDVSIDTICAVAGYAARTTFSRQFKQLNNLTITEYRKLAQGQ